MKSKHLLPALILLPLAAPALAQDSNPYLFGGWNGERQALADKGVEFNFGYTSEDYRNVGSGGRSVGAHAGQLTLSSKFDLEKLWGLPGAEVHLDVSYRDGDDLRSRGVDTLMQPQEVYGRDQTWRLTGLWWGQHLFDDHLFLKLGRLTVGGEFGDVECTFVNQGLCGTEAGNINGDYWYNWPISQWAAVGQVQFDATHYLKLGVYQVNPALLERGHKFTLNPSGTTGSLFPVELGWTPKFAGDLPGAYKVGAWYSNIDKADVFTDVNGDPSALSGLNARMRDGVYGGYFTFEQQLTRGHQNSARSGLRTFVNATVSDRRTSTIDRTLAVGAIYAGLFASRPTDEIGVGASALHVNEREKSYQALLYQQGLSTLPADGSEYTAELFYGWQATGWLRFQPEVQWIFHAGNGAANLDNYTIVGVKTSINF
ncbi:carbohydrate porin [Pseudoxanthomonas sp.]|uniref:carbohydrate porin n=1 Tax=Pseudoxanthomonas sp. TaxID=1871049 RepID=UPI002638F637|nr:carbohydrate porin [Pseudoxanthomonas sp.]WDS34963.1 MAG: carbohydrate porin [Pseudoxanthomonas sp.]